MIVFVKREQVETVQREKTATGCGVFEFVEID